MKTFVQVLIVLAICAFDALMVFVAWFTAAYFGFDLTTLAVGAVCLSCAAIATLYGVRAWRQVAHNDFAV